MADTLTLTYDFTQPEVGASKDVWGDKLNANWEKIDQLLTQAFSGGDFDTIGVIRTTVLPTNGSAVPYVLRGGDTMTGALKLSAEAPMLRLEDTGEALDLKVWANYLSSGLWTVAPQTDGHGALVGYLRLYRNVTGLTDGRLVLQDTSATPDGASLITRDRGDARYLRLSGGTITGGLTLDNATAPAITLIEQDQAAGTKRWVMTGSGGTLQLIPRGDANEALSGGLMLYRDDTGVTDARLTGDGIATTPPNTSSLITTARGDGRYLRLSGGTLTGQLRTAAGDVGTPGIGIGGNNVGLYLGASNTLIVSLGGVAAGRVSTGTGTTDAIDVMTRGKGDARYLTLSGGTLTGGLKGIVGSVAYGFEGHTAGFTLNTTSIPGSVSVSGDNTATDVLYYGGSGGPSTPIGPSTILSQKMGDGRYTLKTTLAALLTPGGPVEAMMALDDADASEAARQTTLRAIKAIVNTLTAT